jgi:hypothetical protein
MVHKNLAVGLFFKTTQRAEKTQAHRAATVVADPAKLGKRN